MERIKLILLLALTIGCSSNKLQHEVILEIDMDKVEIIDMDLRSRAYLDYPRMPSADESEDEYWMWPVK